MSAKHTTSTDQLQRFRFGANWQSFLNALNEERIQEAEKSLCQMLNVSDLTNRRFLDIGSGSGLFSLAARRLGAQVHSFDYDSQSVACTQTLKQRFFTEDPHWQVEHGSALDAEYLSSLGKFDIVYSWGVLHHTRDMTSALQNALIPLADQGLLFIAIYNDQGIQSKIWQQVKKTYCASTFGRIATSAIYLPWFTLQSIAIGLLKHRNPIDRFSHYKKNRGMSLYHDWIDWLSGYPFEVAKAKDIIHLYQAQGLALRRLTTTNRLGCNQFVFYKS